MKSNLVDLRLYIVKKNILFLAGNADERHVLKKSFCRKESIGKGKSGSKNGVTITTSYMIYIVFDLSTSPCAIYFKKALLLKDIIALILCSCKYKFLFY